MAVTKRTRSQVKEALAYWKKQLRKLNEGLYGEEDEEKGDGADPKGDGDKSEEPDPEEEDDPEFKEKDAKDPAAFAKFNPMKRIVRLHNAAKRKVAKLVSDKFLNKWKAGSEKSVVFKNSAIDDDEQTFEYEKGGTMVITMTVSIDKAKVKGFRKMMAVLLKESTFKRLDSEARRLDEGIWDIFKSAVGSAAKTAKVKAGEAIDRANNELKEKVGMFGIQEYVRRLCGKDIMEKLRAKSIEIGYDEADEKEALEYVYKAAVTFS